MDQNFIEIAALAAIAAFVLYRLYATLGRRPGGERPNGPRPAPVGAPSGQADIAAPSADKPTGPVSEGLLAITRADPRFDETQFVAGAKAAYELIVTAFSKGDKNALEPLLTPRVFDSYAKIIDERSASGGKGPELVRLRSAEIVDSTLENGLARIVVKFLGELAEGEHNVRDAREKWTFERLVRADNPNWRLSKVTSA